MPELFIEQLHYSPKAAVYCIGERARPDEPQESETTHPFRVSSDGQARDGWPRCGRVTSL